MTKDEYGDLMEDLGKLHVRHGEYPGTVRIPERMVPPFGREHAGQEYFGVFRQWCMAHGIVVDIYSPYPTSVYQVP